MAMLLVAAVLTGWVAAGSVGLLGVALRTVLTWCGLVLVTLLGWPPLESGRRGTALALAGLALAGLLAGSRVPPVPVLGVAMVLAALAGLHGGVERRVLQLAAWAVAALALFRLACYAIAAVWLGGNALGGALGRATALLMGTRLEIGLTFGGIDFLVTMSALAAGWLRATPRERRRRRAAAVMAAIVTAHAAYLAVLAVSTELADGVPPHVRPAEPSSQAIALWVWADTVRLWLPWGLPLLAGLFHGGVALAMVRWMPLASEPAPQPVAGPRRMAWLDLAAPSVAVLAALILTLTLAPTDLRGKTVVAWQRGYLDWRIPDHERYGPQGAGMYGLLPRLVESLGGRFLVSRELAEADLRQADVLLLIHPVAPWTGEQRRRVERYVRDGGSLLVASGVRVFRPNVRSAPNEPLRATAIAMRYDTATPAAFGWRQVLEATAHPATVGLDENHAAFGQLRGVSLAVRWPAWPILVGRWGWSDPGSDAIGHEYPRFDAGEPLGDQVLAAGQRLGGGRVVALGDTSGLANQFSFRSYEFTARLLSQLAHRNDGPHAPWRQIAGTAALAGLAVLLVRSPDPWRQAATWAVLAAAMIASTSATASAARAMPDTARLRARGMGVAYITASHREPTNVDSVLPDGLSDFAVTLARNGFLPCVLPEVSAERLDRADLLVVVAPAKAFSRRERAEIRRFVGDGGVLICMAGAEESGPLNGLLAEFGLRVVPSPLAPDDPQTEPVPWGYHRERLFPAGDDTAHVRFYAGWAVECSAEQPLWTLRGPRGERGIAVVKQGAGRVAIVGDTAFATNKNLEQTDSGATPHELENAHFWRYFLETVLFPEQ